MSSSPFVSYEEASRWYQAEGVTTPEQLKSRAKQGLPDRIPADPALAYPEEFKAGSLDRFLGTDRSPEANQGQGWASYEEASRWYQGEGVATSEELRARAKQGMPADIPADPTSAPSSGPRRRMR